MVDVREDTRQLHGNGGGATNGAGKGVYVQDSTITDIRRLAAPLGLKEYWYPALEATAVKSKPVGLKLLGEDLVFFRGANKEIKAFWNVCPHRGGSLMKGDCHFEGTISCPYHGWTFDGDGNCLAVLPEGPDSKIPGKVKARVYPTITLKGMVFVWMGEGEAVAPEEDIPPEFFDTRSLVLFATEYWAVNWQLGLENGLDAHVPYVHRNAIRTMMNRRTMMTGPVGIRNKIVKDRLLAGVRGGGGSGFGNAGGATRFYFPALKGYWPKHNYRGLWNWLFIPMQKRGAKIPPWDGPEEWGGGHRAPCMFRSDHRTDLYTRNCIPVTEELSRQIYFKAVRPNSWVGRWYERIHFKLYGKWMQVTNFSQQDMHAMVGQRYDTQEYLSSTDTHQIVWRRLILQSRGMLKPEEAAAIDETKAERTSFEAQEQWGLEPERIENMVKH